MPKLFNGNHGGGGGGGLLQTLFKIPFEIPQFLTAVSFIHYPKENPDVVSKLGFLLNEFDELQSSSAQIFPKSEPRERGVETTYSIEKPAFRISHPWPEWVDLMEVLVEKGYFDDGSGDPFGNGELGSKDFNLIRTACLNFGRDRLELIRYLSRRHIQVIVGFGCPSTDRKVVNSGKRLRVHVGIDEGNVCSACCLRGNCERAYVKAREDEVGRTVDVMRFLISYGLSHITESIQNKLCQTETVQKSVRRLLKEMVELSQTEGEKNNRRGKDLFGRGPSKSQGQGHIEVPMKQGDWICPVCNFLNFARNIKCLRCNGVVQDRIGKSKEDEDHLPLKKGDWICEKCNFLNFAKNSKCLRCQEKPPKRQLDPGEWQCDSCHYINFRKNEMCRRCEYKRPKALNSSDPSPEVEHEEVDTRRMIRSVNDEAGETNGKTNEIQERGKRCRSSKSWKFVEDEVEEDWTKVGMGKNDVLEFMDFPIKGGAGELSRDEHKMEKWKSEMVERKRNDGKCNAQEHHSMVNRRNVFLEGTDDDDDMDEWFGKAEGGENG